MSMPTVVAEPLPTPISFNDPPDGSECRAAVQQFG